MKQEFTSAKHTVNNDLELTQLIKRIWIHRKTVFYSTAIIFIIGTVWSLTTPQEFTASTKVLSAVQAPSRGASRLSSLVSLAGLNIGSSVASNDLSPNVYPEIISSLPFQEDVLATEVDSKKHGRKMSLQDYLLLSHKKSKKEALKKYTIRLPKTIINSFRKKPSQSTEVLKPQPTGELISLSGEQSMAIGLLKKALTLTFDESSGAISLEFVLNEAQPAAQATLNARKVLEEKVKEFKIHKAENQLAFVEDLYKEKKRNYEAAQKALSDFRDANRIISNSKGFDEQQQLQDNYNSALSLFNQISNQLETKKIEVQENMPVFSIIQPVIVPKSSSGPNRLKAIIVALFVGIFIGLSLVFLQEFRAYIEKRW